MIGNWVNKAVLQLEGVFENQSKLEKFRRQMDHHTE